MCPFEVASVKLHFYRDFAVIEKKIHYCWLSGEELPSQVRMCLDSWKKVMPEYEIVCWDKSKFDTNSNIFVKEACSVKKWAFAADYIRLYALNSEGGIYLDSDVLVKRKFDEFLGFDFFTSLEYHHKIVDKHKSLSLLNSDGSTIVGGTHIEGIGIQAAVLGGVKGHPFLKDCLDFYKNQHFILANGRLYNTHIAPSIFAIVAEKHGFRYRDELQKLPNNMLILPSQVFAGFSSEATESSYAIHYCAGSWREKTREISLRKIKNKLIKIMVERIQ